MKIETLAVHAGHEIDPSTGAVAAPVVLSTTFERDVDGNYSRGHMYTRNSNPNRAALEAGISALEGGAEAAAFSSGMGTAMALFQSLQPGDHILAHVDAYYGMTRLLEDFYLGWGLKVDFVDMSDLDQVGKNIRAETRLVWTGDAVESAPEDCRSCGRGWDRSPEKRVSVSAITRGRRSFSARSSSVSTSSSTPPPNISADIATCSAAILVTKTKTPFFDRVRQIQYSGGAVPSPFDCWLVHRGMQTLALAHSGAFR